MSRRPPPNSINRGVLNDLNDRENLRKIIKSREFNLERQKELKKIIKETTENLVKAQKKKTNNLKKNRGKNLRGEYKINDALKRRYERGERRYKPGEEPRIYGDPPVVAGGGGVAGMSDEDRQLKREELAQQLLLENRKLDIQEARELADVNIRQYQVGVQERQLEFQEGQELAAVDYRNRLAELQELGLRNERDMRAEENEIRRLELEGRRQGQDIPFINVGNEQFFNNLLSGVATEQQRGREHTERIMHELLEHNRRTQGAMGADILEQLFRRARESGLRPPSEPASLPPNPAPPSVILAGDRPTQPPPPYSEIADRVRSILSEPAEGSVGALTELERELNREPIVEESSEGLVRSLVDTNSEIHGGLGFGDNISEISSGERFHRLVDEAEAVWDRTAEGIEHARRQQAERDAMPDFLLVDNPLEEIDLTESEVGRLDEDARERDRSELGTLIEEELQELREQQITTDRLNQLENQVEEEQVEVGAGVGDIVAQAGQAVGGALVGAADIGLRAAGGVLQGAGEAIVEQLPALPTAGQVGAAAGRGLVAAGGAALQGAAGLVGAAAQGIVGGGEVEELEEGVEAPGGATDEGELLESVPIPTRNPAEIQQENADFDYPEFIIHHGTEASRRGRPPVLQQQLGAKYSISNVSDRDHKKLSPGQKVDITSYGQDAKGDTIGYFGIGGGVSAGEGGNRRETKLQLQALNKSIDKGFLKLHKNY